MGATEDDGVLGNNAQALQKGSLAWQSWSDHIIVVTLNRLGFQQKQVANQLTILGSTASKE
ncbi:hypothetical protein M404DRAFT_726386 [Pisolithus tinctorius Marx 270]|uniref:Uncharacterized protein n=1 Tax=Pisolithus tinctorius Marx 270 TaxID=870435 RepID=A0A0C3JVQ1_PISTI|nr:hypothetical protein M404DRAFT_726386 [Pisolithus tinctorius Marx 270]